MIRFVAAVLAVLALAAVHGGAQSPAPGARIFFDDFEHGLDAWRVHGQGVRVRASGDARHGQVLELVPNGDVLALIKGSESWGGARMEGEMLFVDDGNNYLGFAYNFRQRGRRMDFGLVYLKGNENYLQANPQRDFNVSRTFYPEARATISGRAAVTAGVWQRFAVEVIGPVIHVYIGDAATPQLTFGDFEFASGAIGLQPRSVGGDVWVDNVAVTRITRFSYNGPDVPVAVGPSDGAITTWQVAGPFDRTRDEGAREPGTLTWRPFEVDRRGGVATGTVTDYHGPKTVAYFRTRIHAAARSEQALVVSTADDLAIWLNGTFQAFLPRQDLAWFDGGANARHPGRSIPLSLIAGTNDLVVRVRGGVYASGGFFARLSGAPGAPQAGPLALDRLDLTGALAEATQFDGRPAVRLLEADVTRQGGLAIVRGVHFTDGVIEVDVAGRRGPHAVPDDRGFIGVAFRVSAKSEAYEYIYLRPDNGRADDQVRRNHSTQYAAHPAFTFDRLRRESPERYESYVDLQPGAWTRMRIEVSGRTARLFVHDAAQPALVVTDLKLGSDGGAVGLWIGPGTEGYFSNLRITPRP